MIISVTCKGWKAQIIVSIFLKLPRPFLDMSIIPETQRQIKPDDLVGTTEAVKILKITLRHLYRLVEDRKLNHVVAEDASGKTRSVF